jgi:hypothetical protein
MMPIPSPGLVLLDSAGRVIIMPNGSIAFIKDPDEFAAGSYPFNCCFGCTCTNVQNLPSLNITITMNCSGAPVPPTTNFNVPFSNNVGEASWSLATSTSANGCNYGWQIDVFCTSDPQSVCDSISGPLLYITISLGILYCSGTVTCSTFSLGYVYDASGQAYLTYDPSSQKPVGTYNLVMTDFSADGPPSYSDCNFSIFTVTIS